MRQFLLISTSVIGLTVAHGQTTSQPTSQFDFLKFPSYDKVVTEFYNNYSSQEILQSGQINFEKCPTGWNISIKDYNSDRIELLRN